jgi:hypothetical protein
VPVRTIPVTVTGTLTVRGAPLASTPVSTMWCAPGGVDDGIFTDAVPPPVLLTANVPIRVGVDWRSMVPVLFGFHPESVSSSVWPDEAVTAVVVDVAAVVVVFAGAAVVDGDVATVLDVELDELDDDELDELDDDDDGAQVCVPFAHTSNAFRVYSSYAIGDPSVPGRPLLLRADGMYPHAK